MASDSVLSPSLPTTAAARRRARLKQWALTAIPFLLFAIAAGLRVWEPDLVPFGLRQAEYVSLASARAPVSWFALYADQTVTPLMLVEPLLRQVPSPVLIWVVSRGLLDGLGVVLLFLAARPLVGVWGAGLAALLYAVNPAVWAATRDPAGPLTAMMMAAALWAAVRLVHSPTLLRGAIFGAALGLLARSGPAGLIVVPLGAVTLALGRASWRVGGVTALALVLVAGPALYTWLPPIHEESAMLGYPLALPAWLLEGHLYDLLSGWIYQRVWNTHILNAHSWFPWFDGRDLRSPYAPLWAASLTTALLLGAGMVSLFETWRRRTRMCLPLAWLLVLLFVAYPRGGYDMDIESKNVRYLLSFAGPLTLLPSIALLLVVPLSARHSGVQWAGAAGIAILLGAGMLSLGREMQALAQAEWQREAFAERPFDHIVPTDPTFDPDGLLRWSPSLREVEALARTSQESAARVGIDEIVRVSGRTFEAGREWQGPLQPRGPISRTLPGGTIPLPLERETAYRVSGGFPLFGVPTPEFNRPSSITPVFTPDGADTGAHIITVRARPATDWLVRATAIPSGRFGDGSALVGIVQARSYPGRANLALYWELPAAADGRSIAERVRLGLRGENRPIDEMRLPSIEARRGGELVLIVMGRSYSDITELDQPLVVTLQDNQGAPIRRPDGSTELELPIRVQHRCDFGRACW